MISTPKGFWRPGSTQSTSTGEHQAPPVRQTPDRGREAETLEGSSPGIQEAAHALDAGVEKQACEAVHFHSMNVTDDLDQNRISKWRKNILPVKVFDHFVLNEGTYRVTNRDGTTGTITVKPGSSLIIRNQSTIERV